jgi:hypothetical protein
VTRCLRLCVLGTWKEREGDDLVEMATPRRLQWPYDADVSPVYSGGGRGDADDAAVSAHACARHREREIEKTSCTRRRRGSRGGRLPPALPFVRRWIGRRADTGGAAASPLCLPSLGFICMGALCWAGLGHHCEPLSIELFFNHNEKIVCKYLLTPFQIN